MIAGLFGLALLSLPDSPLATDYKATRPLSVSNPSAVNIGTGLSSNQQLNANQYLLSNNGQYELDMLPNGVGVLWANLPGTSPCPMWTFPPTTYNLFSNDAWTLMATPSPGDYLVMQDDGNFVQYPAPGEAAIWASDTANNSGATLSLQDDGNLVIYLGSTAIWSTSTNDYRGPVLCKGNSLEANQGLVQSAFMYNPVAVGATNTIGAYHLLVTTSGSLELLSAGPPNTTRPGRGGLLSDHAGRRQPCLLPARLRHGDLGHCDQRKPGCGGPDEQLGRSLRGKSSNLDLIIRDIHPLFC